MAGSTQMSLRVPTAPGAFQKGLLSDPTTLGEALETSLLHKVTGPEMGLGVGVCLSVSEACLPKAGS